ncbi:hypothetical protein [Nonomuraea endophytica]
MTKVRRDQPTQQEPATAAPTDAGEGQDAVEEQVPAMADATAGDQPGF